MMGLRSYAVKATALALLGLALLAPDRAEAQVTQDSVKQRIEAAYPVQVLRVESGEVNGEAAWMVTMMNEGGDFNEAFQVNTIAVSKATGGLIPSFRHGASGYDLPPVISGGPGSEVHPGQMRAGPWR